MSRARRVLWVVPRFHTNLYYATRALLDAGITPHILCATSATLENHEHVTPRVALRGQRGWRTLHAVLREIDPELVIIRRVPGLSERVLWLARMQRRRIIGYSQRPANRAGRRRRSLGGLLRRPRRRITPVLGLGSDAAGDTDAVYLPFPVAVRTAPRDYAPEGTVRILAVGKLAQPRKNHLLLIAALEQLADLPFALTIAGAGGTGASGASDATLDAMLARVAHSSISSRISLLADVPFARMTALYAAHDICVLAAQHEPLGTSPLEAMGQGCVPVISDDAGSAGYIAGTGVGALFPAGDGGALAVVLRGFIAEAAALPARGEAARQLAAREFSMPVFAERFARLLG